MDDIIPTRPSRWQPLHITDNAYTADWSEGDKVTINFNDQKLEYMVMKVEPDGTVELWPLSERD